MSRKLFSFVSILLVICSYMPFYAQEFEISEYSTNKYSVDRNTQIVYYEDMWTGDIYEYDFNTQLTSLSRFSEVPIFANKKHLCVSSDGSGSAIIYNLDTDSSYYMPIDLSALYICFSPNDSGIVWGVGEGANSSFYSIIRNKHYDNLPLNIRWEYPSPAWSSDSTMLFLNSNENAIENINLFTGERDTVFISTAGLILWFDYNIGTEFISYSIDFENDYAPKMRRYYFNEKKDSVFYNFNVENPGSHCIGGFFGFTNMEWSPDNKHMAFFLTQYVSFGTGILCYSLDSNKSNLYTACDEYGKKHNIEWLNNDTILYADYTENSIYYFKIGQPYTMVEDFDVSDTYQIDITNYPNPFNPTTTIAFSVPERANVVLKVFDLLGQQIAVFNEGMKQPGSYEIEFNAEQLPSGVYVYTLQANDRFISKKMVLLR